MVDELALSRTLGQNGVGSQGNRVNWFLYAFKKTFKSASYTFAGYGQARWATVREASFVSGENINMTWQFIVRFQGNSDDDYSAGQ
jgi:hypothetical protein